MPSTSALRNRLRILYAEQDGLCFYCDKKTWLPWERSGEPKLMATREHIVRKCDGGRDDIQNLAMACLECNAKRGCKTPEEWIAERGGEMPTDADGCVYFGSHGSSKTYDFTPQAVIGRRN